jgi:hypothetical protein
VLFVEHLLYDELYLFSLFLYTLYLITTSLAFIIFGSTCYSAKRILLNQTINEYSRYEIENLLIAALSQVIGKNDAVMSTEA